MSDDVLTTLSSVLSRLTVTELRSLDELGVPWLPPLQKLSPRRAVNKIVGSLQAKGTRRARLECVALLYCWLLPRQQQQQPWYLFSVEEVSKLADFRRLLERSAAALRLRSNDVTLQWTLRGGAVQSCLLIENLEAPASEEMSAAYVVLWPGLPLLAVHAPVRHARRAVLLALSRALRDFPVKRLNVPRQDLGAAFRASLALLGLSVDEGTLDVPAMAVPPGRELVLDMLPLDIHDVKTKERLAEWEAAMAELGPLLRPVQHSYQITDGSSAWVRFEGPNLMEKLRRLYARGFNNIISLAMKPAFLGEDTHVVGVRN